MFFRFLIFSGLAALVNIATGYVLYELMGLRESYEYGLSVGAAFVAGMGVSFTLNRAYTYEPSGRRRREELVDFTAVSIVGLGLTTVLAYGLRWLISGSQSLIAALPATPETSAHIAAVGLTAFYSFFAHRHFSFRKQKTRNTGQTSARSDRKAA